MSTHKVEVIRLGELKEHGNADSLWITSVFNYPVITRKGGFQEGDLVAYIPVDSLVPDTEEWNYLAPDGTPVGQVDEKYRRIKARKLRGVFSMGLLHPAPPGASVGDNVADILGITKYIPPESLISGGEDEPDHPLIPKYTDIENFRRYSTYFNPGEDVVITEKLHGANSRFVYLTEEVAKGVDESENVYSAHKQGRLYVGSHGKLKKFDPKNQWWAAALKYDLESKLSEYPNLVFYGELIGTQDLKYGLVKGEQALRFFDILDTSSRSYLDYDKAQLIFQVLDLPTVPPVYRGPLPTLEDLHKLTEVKSHLADNICEGVVIKPTLERYDLELGRVILKLISEQYLTRKGGTEAK